MTVGISAVGHASDTLVVSPAGPYRTVTAAVARAADGDVVLVRRGVYREPEVSIERAITLAGEPGAVLDAGGQHQILVVRANDVTVRGLTLRHVGTSYVEDRAAIRVTHATGCVIENNRIEDAFFGIYLAAVAGCRVSGNDIRGLAKDETSAGNGIHLWSSNGVTIEDNRISGHRDGIYFEFVRQSEIHRNVSEGNLRYGLHFMYSDDCRYVGNTFRRNLAGVAVMYTKRVTMIGNRFEQSWGSASYGLLFKEIYDARVEGNVFDGNTIGFFVDGANRLIARRNRFTGNGWAVKLMANADGARFDENDFIGNTFNVATNSRQSFTTFSGNYWDDYRGYDLNHDGAGDVPHHPVRLFSLLVEQNPPMLILLRSGFVGLLDAAERIFPSLTPPTMADDRPAMHPVT